MKKGLIFFLFILLIFLSLFPRIIEVMNQNYVFGFDQGRDYLAVKSIVVNHKLTLIGSEIGAGVAGFRGIFHGPFYYYSLCIPFIIFNGNPYGGIVLMFLFSISVVVFGFYFSRRIFGTLGGFMTALLIAISPPLISQARFVWNSHPTTIFILLAFYFTYLSLKEKKSKFIFLAAFFSGFIYNFELAIAIPMSIALLACCFFVFQKGFIKNFIALILGFTIAYSPMILFELKHGFLASQGIVNYIFHPQNTAVTLKFIELITKDHLGTFLYNFIDTFPKQNVIPSPIIPLTIFILNFFYLFKEKNFALKRFMIYLSIVLPLVTFLVFSFLRDAIYVYYLIDLNLVYILMFAYIIYSSQKVGYKMIRYTFIILLVVFSIPALISAIRTSQYDYSDFGGVAKVKGKLEVINYIYKDANSKQFGLLVFTPPIYTYAYDYLIWWHANKKYHYIPHNEKKALFYLLIEPDGSKPWSYKGWLETVIKTGKIIEEKRSPSGFIIQKRIENEI